MEVEKPKTKQKIDSLSCTTDLESREFKTRPNKQSFNKVIAKSTSLEDF